MGSWRFSRSRGGRVYMPRSVIISSEVWWDQDAFAHFRSDNGITLDVGGIEVASWLDGTETYDLLQASDGDQPTWTASDSVFNNTGTLLGDGVSEVLREAVGSGTIGAQILGGSDNPFTVYFTARNTAYPATEVAYSMGTSTTGSYLHDFGFVSVNGRMFSIRRDTGGGAITGSIENAGGVVVHTARFSGTTISTWINNTLDLNESAQDLGDLGSNPNRSSLFARSRNSVFDFANITLNELRIYNTSHSDAKRLSVQVDMAAYSNVVLA